MEIEEIKKLIYSDKYNFLRKDKHIKNKIMLLTIGGSHAYGTNVEGSDVDIRGVVAESPKEIIGLTNFEQFENKETDTTLYAFRKIVSLLLNCNPNTIELLGTKDKHIFEISEEGKLLRDNIDLFLSRKAAQSFGGYANQQLRRLENALARDKYHQDKKEEHILKSIQGQMVHFKENYENFDNGSIDLYISQSDKESYDTEIFMNIDLKNYPLRDFKNIYSEMAQVIKSYGKLQYRNRKKTEEGLLKHAMHLIRLLIMGAEILSGQGVNTYREKDKELLLDIRNGKYSYEEIFDMVDKYDKEFVYAKDNTILSKNPDYNKIEDLVMTINKGLLKKYGVF